ncbi:HVO_2523 family zinc finger protein [Halobaculum lipolyticum]|uniref:HVO_2523 family zinc finger protein n=1 Tax=Halobaculum lipolyticum TaxID=3032001 RepID=A0ABD5WE84_9EURY
MSDAADGTRDDADGDADATGASETADSADAGERTGADSVKRTRPCPYCGASMVHRHCEYVCPQHGVVFDCSDPFYG